MDQTNCTAAVKPSYLSRLLLHDFSRRIKVRLIVQKLHTRWCLGHLSLLSQLQGVELEMDQTRHKLKLI